MQHQVITSEKVPFNYSVAGLGSRFFAILIDLGLLVVLAVMGVMLGNVLEMIRPGLGSGAAIVWLFALFCGYFVLFEWLWLGQTPGKRAMGLRVIAWDGTTITLAQSVARNLLRLVDILPGFYGVAFLVAVCNREQRRLGDLAGNTLVVHLETRPRLLFVMAQASTESERSRRQLFAQQVQQLSREQQQTVLDLWVRRNQLRVRARVRLFQALANYFTERTGLVRLEHESDEKFVSQLAAVLTAEQG